MLSRRRTDAACAIFMEEPMVTSNQRRVLPSTRRSTTHKFAVAGHEGYLTIGLFEDGTPGEIFIKMSKEGSTLSGLIQGFCRAFSLALQYGLTVQDAVDRFIGMRFDPMGPTNNPEIPEATSILDYVARYLDLFDRRRRGEELPGPREPRRLATPVR
ncbi:MAG: TSCPD domain-containing protein [Planctomycetota bacterium]|jgi:ribonucleoside-diphosphate reductase alpha chain